MGKSHTLRYSATSGILPNRHGNHEQQKNGNAVSHIQELIETAFGLRDPESAAKRISLRELYVTYTGDTKFTGIFQAANISSYLRSTMGIDDITFPAALSGCLNKRLSKSYQRFDFFFEDVLISSKTDVKTFFPVTLTQIGEWDELPEFQKGEKIPELPDSQGASAEFLISKKGAILPIPIETIINDDIDFISAITAHFGELARKMHARFVWSHYTGNRNCNDGTAWFSSSHENLGSEPLSIQSLTSAITTLAGMEVFGPATDPIGLSLRSFKWNLIIPITQWAEAVRINQTHSYYTSNDLMSKKP